MDDLISRAAAIDAIVSVTVFPDAEYIKNLCQNPANSEDWLGGVCNAINAVEDVNTVDAAPVVHGRWIYKERHRKSYRQYTGYDAVGETHTIMVLEESEGKEPYCSECGAQSAESFMDFCPHCGAKMKEGERRDDDAAD